MPLTLLPYCSEFILQLHAEHQFTFLQGFAGKKKSSFDLLSSIFGTKAQNLIVFGLGDGPLAVISQRPPQPFLQPPPPQVAWRLHCGLRSPDSDHVDSNGVFTLVMRGRFLTSASKFNVEPNGGIVDVSMENDRASPNMKTPFRARWASGRQCAYVTAVVGPQC